MSKSCERVLAAVAAAIARARPAPRVSVAFSGGMDSTVLLEAVCRVAVQLDLALPRALHVDHGLEAEAASWHRHCRHWCAARGIAFRHLPVTVRAERAQGPEAAARDARYGALAQVLERGELLCVAHHADDQAETVLLNLLRGAGPLGTGAMRESRALGHGRLLRPLLDLRRSELADCARRWSLRWVSDPANQRERHPRNRLRHQVMPLLESINPSAVEALTASAGLNREAAGLAAELTRSDLGACREAAGCGLRRSALLALSSPRLRAVLRQWLQDAGARVPGRAHLEEMERQVRSASGQSSPRFDLGAVRVQLERDRVLLLQAVCARPRLRAPQRWRPGERLELAAGCLWAEPGVGVGLRDGAPVEIRFRAGGERCRPVGRRHSQTLKRLLQEYRVPAWQRGDLPLLYRDGRLVGVAGVFVCAGHQAQPGEAGWQVRWSPSQVGAAPAGEGVAAGTAGGTGAPPRG